MPLESELKALMTSTVSIEPATTKNKYGEPAFGPAVEVKAYLVRKHVKLVTDNGEELVSEVQAILADPTLSVSTRDRLTLPDGSQPRILEIQAANDEYGPYYLEIRA